MAITGNMGSGKTVVCEVFRALGIPVFNADEASNYELSHNPQVIAAVKALLGDEVYNNNIPDRKRIAEIVFNDADKLNRLNAIMHPAAVAHFKHWCEQQSAPYIIKEAAILFESGTDKGVDKIITVTAPEALRIARIKKRNPQWSEKEIKKRLERQWPEEEKVKRSDFVIVNDEKHSVIEQVLQIHKSLTT